MEAVAAAAVAGWAKQRAVVAEVVEAGLGRAMVVACMGTRKPAGAARGVAGRSSTQRSPCR